MTDDTNQKDTEQLFASEPSEGDKKAVASNSRKAESKPEHVQDYEQPEAEESKEPFRLDDEVEERRLSPQEIQMQKQIDVWVDKIVSGERGIDELPRNQEWMIPHIEERINQAAKAPEIEDIVERKLQQREEARQFDQMKNDLERTPLSRTQKEDLQQQYQDLRQSGLTQAKALKIAMQLAGVDPAAHQRDEMRKRMALPRSGFTDREEPTGEISDVGELSKLSEDKRLELYESTRKANQVRVRQ